MAGNVTFIVGNGLDVSLKLETSYRDFYSYVKENELHPGNSIYEAIEKEDPEYWADFERGLGRHTDNIELVNESHREEWSSKLNDELDDIITDLKKYVAYRNSYADSHIPNINFTSTSYYHGLEPGQVRKIQKQVPRNAQPAFRFITLNYTDVLEKVFPHAGKTVVGPKYQVVDPIHHIHGSIDARITLGVSDETQLSSYLIDDEKNYMIKPEIMRMMNSDRIETMARYLSLANVVVLFGVSIGETDRYIWQMVADWLHYNSDRILIIHKYERDLANVNDLTDRQHLKLCDRVMNKFLSHSDLDESLKISIKKQIYVIPNTSELFSLKA